MIEAMNIVYQEAETRGFIKLNLLSLLYTLVMILAVIVTLSFIVIAPTLIALLPIPDILQTLFNSLQWPILSLMIIMLLNFTYCYFPDRQRAKWRWITYGSLFAGIVWIVASALFSYYVGNFGDYNKTYGSVGAVVVLMIWFYISGFIFLLGGALNAEMEHQTTRDTTTGEARPMGERGAYVADDLGEEK